MRRRDFVRIAGMMAPVAAQTNVFGRQRTEPPGANKQTDFIHDGLDMSASEYATLLMQLADEGKVKPDYYSNGGIVEELENKFAKLLGKESAVFMPTGTLANHIAVRKLAGNDRRAIVQEQSHFYNDSGDCATTLSNLNLIPAGMNAVEFTLDEIDYIVKKSKGGRVLLSVGAISIETPVRRQHDLMFSYNNIKSIADYAKNNGIGTHLDGARLFVQSFHTGIDPAGYGQLTDTVYTSMWKCFNAASGAVLAGSKGFTENLFQERRMFGGSLPAAWPYAAVALHFADSFADDYKAAWQKAEKLIAAIQKEERFKVIQYENGSHVIRLNVTQANLNIFKDALAKRRILLNDPDEAGFYLKINPSLNRNSVEDVAGYFFDSLKEAS